MARIKYIEIERNELSELRKVIDTINSNPAQLIQSEVLKQLHKIKDIQDANQLSFGVLKSFNEALKPLNSIKYPNDVLTKMKDITTEVFNGDSMKEMRKFTQSISDSIQKMAKAFELPPELKRSIEEFRNAYANAHKELASYSWYLPLSLNISDELSVFKEFKSRNYKTIDAFMLKLIKRSYKDIKKDLIQNYPNRKEILEEGFEALKFKHYHSAICIFISQADGVFGGNLFKNKNNKKQLKDFFKSNGINSWADMILAAIDSENSIDTYHAKVKNSDRILNRHGILHGFYTDYGTELNAYKSLSLLAFVSQIMTKANQLNFTKK